jgi:hypothetical protein
VNKKNIDNHGSREERSQIKISTCSLLQRKINAQKNDCKEKEYPAQDYLGHSDPHTRQEFSLK